MLHYNIRGQTDHTWWRSRANHLCCWMTGVEPNSLRAMVVRWQYLILDRTTNAHTLKYFLQRERICVEVSSLPVVFRPTPPVITLPRWKVVIRFRIKQGQGLRFSDLNRRGPSEVLRKAPTACHWKWAEFVWFSVIRGWRAIHIQERFERTLWDRGPSAVQENSKETSRMHNVGGEQAENDAHRCLADY